jgi:hypothetical protein
MVGLMTHRFVSISRASGQSNMQFSLKSAADSADALANADNPVVDSYNKSGLPAAPFRTVDWNK